MEMTLSCHLNIPQCQGQGVSCHYNMGAGRHTRDRVLTEICDKILPVTDNWLGRSRKRTDGTDTELTEEYSSKSGSGEQLTLGHNGRQTN